MTKAEEYDVLKLWEYTFKDPLDITSMSFITTRKNGMIILTGIADLQKNVCVF